MATQYPSLNENIEKFIQQQKIFFVATATKDSFINLSPKGMDSLKIMDENRACFDGMWDGGSLFCISGREGRSKRLLEKTGR